MKTLALVLLSILLFCFGSQKLNGQQDDCSKVDDLIQKAEALKKARKYDEAITKLTIARDHCAQRSKEIGLKLLEVSKAIQEETIIAEQAEQRAKEAAKREKQSAKDALIAKNIAEIAKNIADSNANIARLNLEQLQQAQKQLDLAATKAYNLQASFPSENTLNYINQQAQLNFQYDSMLIRRNYRDALPYFALSNFLNPQDSTQRMILICQFGDKANDFFAQGKLDSAEHYFHNILPILALNRQDSGYEQLRLQHIDEVRTLAKKYLSQLQSNADSIVLEGNWWTFPERFYQFSVIKKLTLKNNTAIRENWPFVAERLPNLESIKLVNCPNLRRLDQWSHFPKLTSLVIQHNPELETIDNIEEAIALSILIIENNSRLKWIQDLSSLQRLLHLSIVGNERLYALNQLPNAANLQFLAVSNISEQEQLNLGLYQKLEDLRIYELPLLRSIDGIERLQELHKINIAHNPNLSAIGDLNLLQKLRELSIVNIPGITSLANLHSLPALKKITIDSNNFLKKLPKWRSFPLLEELNFRENIRALWFGSLWPLKSLQGGEVLGNKSLWYFILGVAPTWRFGGQNSIESLPYTNFSFPALTVSGIAKWLKFSVQAEYSIANRGIYFPSAQYNFNTCEECVTYFDGFKNTDPIKYAKRDICEMNKNRLRIILKYDIIPYYPIGPIYYLGLGITSFPRTNFPFSLAAGAKYPLGSNYISIDWRFDVSETYRTHNITSFNDLSIGYYFRLGYNKVKVRENESIIVGKINQRIF